MIPRLIAIALFSYLIGGVNGAIETSKKIFKKDIRKFGSGNPGLTNYYRVFGTKGIPLVVFIDMGKSILCALVGGIIMHSFNDSRMLGAEFAAFFVMIGHAFPMYYGFKGGKTVMAVGAALTVIDIRIALICWACFVIVVACTKLVSLGSIIAGAAYPISVLIFAGWSWEFVIAAVSALLLIVRHRQNIFRIIHREEPKLVFRKKEKKL